MRKWYIIYPDESFYNGFEIFITLILLLSSFLTPLDLAFPDIRESFIGFNVTMYAIDFCFFVQIILSFFIATENDQNQMNDDIKLIANNYLKGWFLIDFFSVFPLDQILQYTVSS